LLSPSSLSLSSLSCFSLLFLWWLQFWVETWTVTKLVFSLLFEIPFQWGPAGDPCLRCCGFEMMIMPFGFVFSLHHLLFGVCWCLNSYLFIVTFRGAWFVVLRL
jgi:hypothetical protein